VKLAGLLGKLKTMLPSSIAGWLERWRSRPRCKTFKLSEFTIEWLARHGLLEAIECMFSRRGSPKIMVKVCWNMEPPNWVGEECTCPNGSRYPRSVCRVRGIRLGERRFVIVSDVS